MKDSKIGWTTHSWNPVTGCSKVSPGCDNCYAEVIAERFRGGSAYPVGFDVDLRPHKLRDPIKWRKPARIFVNSMSDMFHREIPDHYLQQIWGVMVEADWHVFQVLTKRPHRMIQKIQDLCLPMAPNIWLGVSVETQEFADNRIPELLKVERPSLRFISVEPLLGDVDLRGYVDGLDWIIVGGESGPNRRHMEYDWARSLRDQCTATSTPFFLKQGNSNKAGEDRVLDGRTHDEFPVHHVAVPNAQSTGETVHQGTLL